MKLQQGDRVVALCAATVPLIFHERYVVMSRGRRTVSLSRGGDAYAEDFGEALADVLMVRKWESVESGMIPPGSIYRFDRALPLAVCRGYLPRRRQRLRIWRQCMGPRRRAMAWRSLCWEKPRATTRSQSLMIAC